MRYFFLVLSVFSLAAIGNATPAENLKSKLERRLPYKKYDVLVWAKALDQQAPNRLQVSLDAMLGLKKLTAQVLHQTLNLKTNQPQDKATLTPVEIFGGTSLPEVERVVSASLCKSPLCLLSEIMGSEVAAAELFLMQMEFGYTVTLFRPIPPALFHRRVNLANTMLPTPAQIHFLARALWESPKVFRKMPTLAAISIFKDEVIGTSWYTSGFILLSSRAIGNEQAVWDLWKAANWTENKLLAAGIEEYIYNLSAYLVIHELAHAFDDLQMKPLPNSIFSESLSNQVEWKALSNWTKLPNPGTERNLLGFSVIPCMSRESRQEANSIWNTDSSHYFVNTYSQTNPKEDFAEHAAAFVIYPDSLKLNASLRNKYDFLKNQFGVEYTRVLPEIQTKCKKSN